MMPPIAAATATLGGLAVDGTGVGVTLATASVAGALSPTDYALLHGGIGTVLSAYRGANLAVAAATPTTVQALVLTAGTWLVQGVGCITQGAAAGNVDLYILGIAGGMTDMYLPATLQQTWVTPTIAVATAGVTINLNVFSPVATTAIAVGGAGGFGSVTGIYAVRIA